jgi:DNA-binding protein YbaB
MDENQGEVPAVLSRFAEARGSGTAAGGLVQVTVDGTGDLVDLVIESQAMRMAAFELSDAIVEAFKVARVEAQQALAESVQVPDMSAAGPLLAGIGQDAQRRLDELTSIAQQLADRIGRIDPTTR